MIQVEGRNKIKRTIVLFIIAALIVIILAIVWVVLIRPNKIYYDAEEAYKNGNYSEAIRLYEKLDNFKDSSEKTKLVKYDYAMSLINDGDFGHAVKYLRESKGENVEKYIEYATLRHELSVAGVSACANLTKLYDRCMSIKDFCDMEEVIENYKFFKLCRDYEGVWTDGGLYGSWTEIEINDMHITERTYRYEWDFDLFVDENENFYLGYYFLDFDENDFGFDDEIYFDNDKIKDRYNVYRKK